MNPRHAAALAVVGWYLMLPPFVKGPDGARRVDSKAPLAQWSIDKSFESRDACEQAKSGLQSPDQSLAPSAANVELRNATLAALQCVPSDDPRLKKH
jgi:hypothetical protein